MHLFQIPKQKKSPAVTRLSERYSKMTQHYSTTSLDLVGESDKELANWLGSLRLCIELDMFIDARKIAESVQRALIARSSTKGTFYDQDAS